jgi:hypothetical protein
MGELFTISPKLERVEVEKEGKMSMNVNRRQSDRRHQVATVYEDRRSHDRRRKDDRRAAKGDRRRALPDPTFPASLDRRKEPRRLGGAADRRHNRGRRDYVQIIPDNSQARHHEKIGHNR